ncbi:hypothetical protein Tco_0458012 [Tanacetum coccineum]
MKVFSNMKRSTKGFSGQEVPLFSSMIDADESSPSSSTPTSSPTPEPSPTSNHHTVPHPLTFTTFTNDEKPGLGLEWQEDIPWYCSFRYVKFVEMNSSKGESNKPTKTSNEQEASGKVSDEISTAGKKKDTASEEVPPVSTAEVHISTAGGTATYSRRKMQRLQDNGKKRKKKKAMDEAKTAKGMSYNEIRPIFEKLWDFNQKFVPMDAEKERTTEIIVEEEAGTQEERKEAVNEPAAKRKKSIPRKTTRKRQKLEVETEKEELKTFLDIKQRLTCTIKSSEVMEAQKNYKILSEMLEDFEQNGCRTIIQMMKFGGINMSNNPSKSWRQVIFVAFKFCLMDNGLAIHYVDKKKVSPEPRDAVKEWLIKGGWK